MSRRSLCSLAAAAALLVALLPGVANATSLGTWSTDPAQSVSSETTTATAYKTQVQQPINADGSSVYKAARGSSP